MAVGTEPGAGQAEGLPTTGIGATGNGATQIAWTYGQDGWGNYYVNDAGDPIGAKLPNDPMNPPPKDAAGGSSAVTWGPAQIDPTTGHSIQVGSNGEIRDLGPAAKTKTLRDSYVGADGKLHGLYEMPDGSTVDEIITGASPVPPNTRTTTIQNADGTTSIVNLDTGAIIKTVGTPVLGTITIDGITYPKLPDGTPDLTKPLGGTSTSGENAANRAANAAEGAANRGASAAENAANREFQSKEAAAARAFTAQENALGRQLDAAQFAATYGLDKVKFLAEVDKNRAEAAKQFADIVSSTDPSALPAYLAAGGGSLSNAVATGQNMITDAALLPAARTLGLARQAAPVLPEFDASKWGLGAGAGSATGTPGTGQPPPTSGRRGRGLGETDAKAASGAPGNLTGGMGGQIIPDALKRNLRGFTPAMAFGGGTTARQFIAGDTQRPGIPNPEMIQIHNPGPETTASVRPLGMNPMMDRPRFAFGTDYLSSLLGTFGSGGSRGTATSPLAPPPPPPPPAATPSYTPPPPVFSNVARPIPPKVSPTGAVAPPPPPGGFTSASGGVAGALGAQGYGLGGYTPTPEERKLMDETYGIRTGVALPWNDPRYFNNVEFQNADPVMQQLMMKGLQSRLGVPIESLWAESRKNALQGMGRQAVGIGY